MTSPDSSLPEGDDIEAAQPVDPDADDLLDDELAALAGGRGGEAIALVVMSNQQEGSALLSVDPH